MKGNMRESRRELNWIKILIPSKTHKGRRRNDLAIGNSRSGLNGSNYVFLWFGNIKKYSNLSNHEDL